MSDVQKNIEGENVELLDSSKASVGVPEIRQFGDQLRLVLESGESLSETVEMAITQLKDRFSDVLTSQELDKRLAHLKNARLVSAEEFERLSMDQEHSDGGGCLIYQMDRENIITIPIIAPHSRRINLLATVLHEGTHLVAPSPHTVEDPFLGESRFVKYVGPARTEHNRETGKVDTTALIHSVSEMNARVLFWEAVTDWVAMEEVRVHFEGEDDERQIDQDGYIEKHYVEWLLAQAPNRQQLEKKMKVSYTSGDEHEFVWELGRQFNTDGWEMYDELLRVLETPISVDNWEERVESWQQVARERQN